MIFQQHSTLFSFSAFIIALAVSDLAWQYTTLPIKKDERTAGTSRRLKE
jgi:hypothetical protein